MKPTPEPYINEPTRLLAEMLRGWIEERRDWREHRGVASAFAAFDNVCRIEPSIVAFVRRAVADRRGSLTIDQIQLIMLATFMRSSSSYGTIPELVVVLNLASDFATAAKVNDNAVHEAGTSTITSHPLLLLDSFHILSSCLAGVLCGRGVRIQIPPLTPASHALLRQMFALFTRNRVLPTDADFRDYLDQQQVYVPPFTEVELQTARHYANLCDEKIARYHSEILAHILGMADRLPAADATSRRRDPTDRGWLAQQAFEFCTREASSADVGDSISYVGAYGLFTNAFLGYVPEAKRAAATKWWWVHSDQDVGMLLGWGTTAEQGHARDARELVDRVFEGLSAENVAAAIRTATAMSHRRLQHWQAVTDRLVELGQQPDAVRVSFNYAEFRPIVVSSPEPANATLEYQSALDSFVLKFDGRPGLTFTDREVSGNLLLSTVMGLSPELLALVRQARQAVSIRVSAKVELKTRVELN